MKRPLCGVRPVAAIALALMVNAVFSGCASAHVKWFAHYDVAQQPIVLEHVFTLQFGYLALVSIVALLVGSVLESTPSGESVLRALDRITAVLERNTELMFRAGCGFFSIAIWSHGGIILTPELHTHSVAIGAIQLVIALGVLWRRTMPLSGLGIAALYAIGVWKYGIFHMADYPIFLGIAAYIALVGLQRDFFGLRPIDIVRWSAGITLMWASIEKWAYPEWSYPLFAQHPQLDMGFSPEFFMRAAGAVEFALAFALMWTPLVRRVAAIMLTAMFVSAVLDFGKIDLIGHLMIVVVLLAVVADSNRKSDVVQYPWLLPFGYSGALTVVMGTYYIMHALIYDTSVVDGPRSMAMAMVTRDTPAHFRPTLSAYTTNHKFFVKLFKVPDPIPYQKYFTLRFAIYDGHDPSNPLRQARMTLFAGVRHGLKHGFAHGMQSSPELVDKNGTIDAEGMYFHMQGRWTLRATVTDGNEQGVAYFDLPCCGMWVDAAR